MRCDIIAEGIVQAATKLNLTIPLVVRLQGKTHLLTSTLPTLYLMVLHHVPSL